MQLTPELTYALLRAVQLLLRPLKLSHEINPLFLGAIRTYIDIGNAVPSV